MRPGMTLFAAIVLVCSQAGCGTLVNLNAPPTEGYFSEGGPNSCQAFGGAKRSALLGCFGSLSPVVLPWNPVDFALVPAGLVALADTPLSFVGDLATLPIVHARQNKEPWATWWGQQDEAKPAVPPVASNQPAAQNAPIAATTNGADSKASLGAPQAP